MDWRMDRPDAFASHRETEVVVITAATGTHGTGTFERKLARARPSVLAFIDRKQPKLYIRATRGVVPNDRWYDGFDAWVNWPNAEE
jgi:hypothetical protein